MANITSNRLTVLGQKNSLDDFLICNKKENFFSRNKQFSEIIDNSRIFLDDFDSRHAPPFQTMKEVGKKFPGLIFALSFNGEQAISGRILIRNGEWVDKESYLIDHLKSVNSFEEMTTSPMKEYTTHHEWVLGLKNEL